MIVTQKGKAERLVIFGSACLLAGVILTSLIPFELRQALWHWNQLCLLQIGVLLETLFLATALGIRAQQTALSLYQSEQARSRLSRDLHDDLGSTLSSIALNSTLAGTLDSPDKMRETLRRISQEAREASANVKDLIWAMYPGSNSTAEVLARMRQFAQNTLDPQGIEYRFDVGEGVENLQLDMESRRHLYLIFKEAVNNAAKYAKSTHIGIRIEREGDKIRLEIADNGKGFDPQAPHRGNGLANMAARALLLGGALRLESGEGKGARVVVEWAG